MIEEHGLVVLTEDFQEYGFRAGDVAVVVLIHGDHEGYELEFIDTAGRTITIISAFAAQVRPLDAHEVTIPRAMSA